MERIISYAPLRAAMKKKHATTCTLQFKGAISSSAIRRPKAGESVSANTLNALCRILRCDLPDIVEYIDDGQGQAP